MSGLRDICGGARHGEHRSEWGPSVYLTDGIYLLRTLWPPIVEGGTTYLEVEDCRTLDVILCAQEELAAMGLRVVAPVREPQLDAAAVPAQAPSGDRLSWE